MSVGLTERQVRGVLGGCGDGGGGGGTPKTLSSLSTVTEVASFIKTPCGSLKCRSTGSYNACAPSDSVPLAPLETRGYSEG